MVITGHHYNVVDTYGSYAPESAARFNTLSEQSAELSNQANAIRRQRIEMQRNSDDDWTAEQWQTFNDLGKQAQAYLDQATLIDQECTELVAKIQDAAGADYDA